MSITTQERIEILENEIQKCRKKIESASVAKESIKLSIYSYDEKIQGKLRMDKVIDKQHFLIGLIEYKLNELKEDSDD